MDFLKCNSYFEIGGVYFNLVWWDFSTRDGPFFIGCFPYNRVDYYVIKDGNFYPPFGRKGISCICTPHTCVNDLD